MPKMHHASVNAIKSTFHDLWSATSLNKKIPFYFLRILTAKMYYGPLVHIWMSTPNNLWLEREKAWCRFRTRPKMIQSLWSGRAALLYIFLYGTLSSLESKD